MFAREGLEDPTTTLPTTLTTQQEGDSETGPHLLAGYTRRTLARLAANMRRTTLAPGYDGLAAGEARAAKALNFTQLHQGTTASSRVRALSTAGLCLSREVLVVRRYAGSMGSLFGRNARLRWNSQDGLDGFGFQW